MFSERFRGTNIPRCARNFTVADVFDALTSALPYNHAMTYAAARKEIEAGTASHFDPEVVDAFLRIPESEWAVIRNSIEKSAEVGKGSANSAGPAL